MKNYKLFVTTKDKYGPNYEAHLFEQYKLYIESAEKISDRRQNANNYFIALNTALLSVIGLSFQLKSSVQITWVKYSLAMIGVVICIVFWFLLRSYKQLNTGKFKVIHEIEQKLPLALYDYEWDILEKGKNQSVYYPFSHVELLIPKIFGLIYIVIAIAFLICNKSVSDYFLEIIHKLV